VSCRLGTDVLARLRFELAEGLSVVVRGPLFVNDRGQVQLQAKDLQPEGQGALALAFEQLKERLAKEGLFAAERKRPLPLLPRCVGVVTSKQGAAVRDMLKVIESRMPGMSVLLSPTRVQGAESAQEVAQALRRLDQSGRCDVILLGRGGGSLEDLWAFNELVVVREVAACQTPVIAAVGHETDTTLTCLVADVRASTPSHAAERAVPRRDELLAQVARDERHLEQRVRAHLSAAELRVRRAKDRLADPQVLLRPAERRLRELAARLEGGAARARQGKAQRLGRLAERLARRSPVRTLEERRRRLGGLRERLLLASPDKRLDEQRARLARAEARLSGSAERRRQEAHSTLAELAAKLHVLSPLAVLERGFALVSRPPGGLVRSAGQLAAGDELELRFSDGRVRAQVRGPAGDDDEEG
jgi:exodeoxyribonuclease VII large subunit